jgi:hypothetical protein
MVALAVALMAGDDPGGWSKARWGMTEEEVVKAFDGQVKRIDVAGNPRGRLGIEALEVAGMKLTVSMGFGADGKLRTVLFEPVNLSDASNDMFQRLENLLVEKYGRPWKSSEGTSTGSTEMQWTFATTVVTLSRDWLGVAGVTSRAMIVTLIYRARVGNPL